MYEHFKKKPKDGTSLCIFLFIKSIRLYQPSECVIFQDINNPRITFKKESHSDGFSEHNYRAYVYIVSYNIFVIKNGIGNLKFVN